MQLQQADIDHILARLPRRVRKVLRDHPVVLAGGFIRSVVAREHMSDIDLFAGSALHAEVAASTLKETWHGCHRVDTDNATTLWKRGHTPVQFIKRWVFEGAVAVLAHFDFTVCQAAVWYDAEADDWASECSDLFYPDLAAHRLAYTRPRDPEAEATLLRVMKFVARGYSIAPEALADIVARCARPQEGMTEEGQVEVQTAYLVERLRAVDPIPDTSAGDD